MRVTLLYRGPHLLRQALELEVLAPLLRLAGHRVAVVYDPDVFGVTDNVLRAAPLARRLGHARHAAARVARTRPELLLLSVAAGTYRWALDVARGVRAADPAVTLVFAGLYPTLAPEQVLADPAAAGLVDYLLQGELEGALPALLQALARGDDPGAVGNLWRPGPGGPRFTRPAPLVDLDALPLPDKTLFSPHVTHAYSYVAMVSRGCTGRCTFCEESCLARVHGKGYFRRKAVDTVMAELLVGKGDFGFSEVIFKDSYLSGDPAWLAALMARYGSEIRRPFKCFCHIRGFTPRTARLLRGAGCYCVEFGLQTWNQPLRRQTLRRTETNAQARAAFAACAEAGLWYDVDHMFNLPGETEQDHREAAAEYRGLRRMNRVKVHFLIYLPGAEIVAQGRAAGDLPAGRGAAAPSAEGDFFFRPGGLVGAGRRADVAGYANLYRLLPLLPGRLLDWLLRPGRPGRVRSLGRLPAPLVALALGVGALRSRDLRFSAYLRLYPRKVLHSALSAVAAWRDAGAP